MLHARRALVALISVIAVVLGIAPSAFAQSTPGPFTLHASNGTLGVDATVTVV